MIKKKEYNFKDEAGNILICKIKSCDSWVWPNKTLGFCRLHYYRYNTGRMKKDGSLKPLPLKIKYCGACHKEIVLSFYGRNRKWCGECSDLQKKYACYEALKRFNERKKNQKLKIRYINFVLKKFIMACDPTIIKMKKLREKGFTFEQIGNEFNCSKQNVQIRLKNI